MREATKMRALMMTKTTVSDGNDAVLLHDQSAGHHEGDHDEVEEKSTGKAVLAKRKNDEDENDKGDGDQRQTKVTRPEFAHVHLQKSGARLGCSVGHALCSLEMVTRGLAQNYSGGEALDEENFSRWGSRIASGLARRGREEKED